MQLVDSHVHTEEHSKLSPYSLGGCHKAFQRLGNAILPSGQRPSPSFSSDKKVEVERFSNNDDERQKAQAKDFGLAGNTNA